EPGRAALRALDQHGDRRPGVRRVALALEPIAHVFEHALGFTSPRRPPALATGGTAPQRGPFEVVSGIIRPRKPFALTLDNFRERLAPGAPADAGLVGYGLRERG